MEVLKNSFVIKNFIALVTYFGRIWPHSIIARSFRALGDSYENSKLKLWWDDFISRKDPADFSVYGWFLRKLEKFFLLFKTPLENSLVNKIFGKLPIRTMGIIAFAFYLPIEYVLRDVLNLGIAGIWEEAFIAGAIVVLVYRAVMGLDDNAISRASSIEVSMILFMAVGLVLMMLNRPYPSIALAGYRAQVEYMVWFMIMLRVLERKEDAKLLIYAFGGVVFLLSLHGIYQYIIAVPIPAGWVSATEIAVRTRVFSITGSPNIFGSLLIMAAPIFASLMYYLEKPLHKFMALCATGIMCLCDLFTFSKGSWIGLSLAVVIFALFVDRRLLGIMAAAVSAIFVLFPSVTNRITYLFTSDYAERSAAAGRTMRWAKGMDLLTRNNKWLGFGLGRFGGAVAMNNKVMDEIDGFQYFYMDNYYMKTLVEMGYIGLFFYLLLLAVLVVFGVKAVGRSGMGYKTLEGKDPLVKNIKNDKILCVGVFCGLCAVLAHCYYENIFEEPYMMAYFWGLAAALMVMGFFSSDKVEKR